VERFHQTMAREWGYGLTYASSNHRARALPHWLQHYRGRDGRCWPPPAQIPACASNALGS
jgi:hypothetical protein